MAASIDPRALERALVLAGSLVFQEAPALTGADLDHEAKTLVRHAAFVAVAQGRGSRGSPFSLRESLEAHVARASLAHRCLPHLIELAQLLTPDAAPPDDLVGVLHDHLLAVALTRGPRGFEVVPAPRSTRQRGAVSTPRSLADSMVASSLGRWLARDRERTRSGLGPSRGARRQVRVLDPACGAGVFLLAALDALARDEVERTGKPTTPVVRARLARDHVFGIDIDRGALQSARLAVELWILGDAKAKQAPRSPGDDFSHNLIHADALLAPLGQTVPEPGFDLVIGNPPYVASELVPDQVRAAYRRFELGRRGQSDLWKLFFERTTRDFIRPGGVQAFLVPDALLARDEHAEARRLLTEELAITDVVHVGTVFDRLGSNVPVGVSAVVVIGEKRTSKNGGATGRPWTIHAPPGWATLKGELEAASVALGSLLAAGPLGITRGEELGKSSLTRIPRRGRGVAVLAGEDVGRHQVQPARLEAPARRVKKPSRYFEAPRVLLVKTGAGPVAAASFESTPPLQSLYVLHLRGAVRETLDEDCVAGVISSALVTAFVFYEWTSCKRTQPQLTIGEVKQIPFPDPARTPRALWKALAARVAEIRARLANGEGQESIAKDERAVDELVARLYGLELEGCLPRLEPALRRLPRSQRPRWFQPDE